MTIPCNGLPRYNLTIFILAVNRARDMVLGCGQIFVLGFDRRIWSMQPYKVGIANICKGSSHRSRDGGTATG